MQCACREKGKWGSGAVFESRNACGILNGWLGSCRAPKTFMLPHPLGPAAQAERYFEKLTHKVETDLLLIWPSHFPPFLAHVPLPPPHSPILFPAPPNCICFASVLHGRCNLFVVGVHRGMCTASVLHLGCIHTASVLHSHRICIASMHVRWHVYCIHPWLPGPDSVVLTLTSAPARLPHPHPHPHPAFMFCYLCACPVLLWRRNLLVLPVA